MSRQSILTLLRNRVVARVSFTVTVNNGTITVNSATFERVATAIEAGTLNLTILPANEMPWLNSGAVYFSTAGTANNPTYISKYGAAIPANSLFSRDTFGRVEEGMVIHEAVHASLDLTSSTGILTVHEEATAMIAEILYNRRMGLSRSRITEQIRVSALPVVETIIRTGTADATHYQNLVNTITAHPLYSANATLCYTRDG